MFLGGPIQYLLEHDNSPAVVASHREIVTALTAAGFSVLSAHEVEDYGDISANFSPEHVTKRDFAWARECDIYVGVLPLDPCGTPYRTDGTHIEIGWATAMGKRTLLVISDTPLQPYSHLVAGLVESGSVETIALENWREELVDALLHPVATPVGHG